MPPATLWPAHTLATTPDEKIRACTAAANIARAKLRGWFLQQPLEVLVDECMLWALQRGAITVSWAVQRLRWYRRQETSGRRGDSRTRGRIDAAAVRRELKDRRDRLNTDVLGHMALLEALSQLPWRERYTVVARFWLDKPPSAIALDLGYANTGSIAWLLHCALRHLRELIDAEAIASDSARQPRRGARRGAYHKSTAASTGDCNCNWYKPASAGNDL